MTDEKYYLTKEGLKRFEAELDRLRKLKASKMRDEVPDIMHSEEVNPEYLSFQEDLELLESRLNELEVVLKNAETIKKPHPSKHHQVHMGATVLVEIDGRVDEFTIVGSLEANPSVGRISDRSPVGSALLGKEKGETVLISSPIKVTYRIKEVCYEL